MIPVTKPTLCDIEDFCTELLSCWENGILTHHGPKVQKFEKVLSTIANDTPVTSVVNGTLALQLSLRALPKKGEVVVPSFTWIATAAAVEYEGFTPIFCDIDQETLNIDTKKITDLISPNTVAILPVHVFGQPCEIIALDRISKKYNLPIIYDAAHAFGSQFDKKSVLTYGDMSCVSFHATKILNTGEGGAIFCKNEHLRNKLKQLRFFGYNNQKNLVAEGTNGKMTEIHASLGLCNIKLFSRTKEKRRIVNNFYRAALGKLNYIKFQKVKKDETNYSYFPIILETEKLTLKLIEKLSRKGIFARRYFFPSLSTIKRFEKQNIFTPISNDISRRIICLPSFYDITHEELEKVSREIVEL